MGPGGTRDLLINQPLGYGTGGFYIKDNGEVYYIDPGPGAMFKINRFGWKIEINNLICTHFHLDHYGDLLTMIEYSTKLRKKIDLITTEQTWNYIDPYHKEFVNYINYKELKNTFKIAHGIDGFGIKIGEVYYTSDGKYHSDILKERSEVLIANITIIDGLASDKHMDLKDLEKFIETIKPSKLILNHFSIHILNRLEDLKKYLSQKYEIEVYIAKEGEKYVL